MLSLYKEYDDYLIIDDIKYNLDLSFNVVLANLDLFQQEKIRDSVKINVALENYMNLTKEELKVWNFEEKCLIYTMISEKIFGEPSNESVKNTEDKSVYSLNEDADFIFSSFLKDYGINLVEHRGKLHWHEFKALFSGLSKDTKMAEVIRIRSWEPTKDTSKEEREQMEYLQRVYALKETQEQLELEHLEREKMRLMTTEERVEYAKRKMNEKGG